jgi:hypothetical protein
MALQFTFPKNQLAALLIGAALTGCTIESTNYYPDGQEDGLAIFSNTGNNLMTGYANGTPWQTRPRSVTVVVSSVKRYELYIRKYNFNGVQDTLVFEWTGNLAANGNNQGDISLSLIMPKGFGYKDFNALQGKRIAVNLTNGYFNSTITGINPGNLQGKGSVYFHTASLDSIGPGFYTGKMSGLIEADFNGNKFAKGRFDHTINSEQMNF